MAVWVVMLAVLVDAASTIVGLSMGLREGGLLATRLIGVLGIAYFAVEAGILYTLYRLLRDRIGSNDYAALIASLGPWLAGWHNIGLVLRGVL